MITNRITVGIPHYNDFVHLEQLLDSLGLQEGELIEEILIVDDGSHPNLFQSKLALNIPLRIIRNFVNRGTGHTRNRILSESKTQFLLLIDSDCRIDDLNFIKQLMEGKGNADIVYPKVSYQDGKAVHPRDESEKIYPRMSTCFLVNLKSLRTHGLCFREFLKFFYEDEDFFIRCQGKGLSAKFMENLAVIHVRPVTGYEGRGFTTRQWYNFYLARIYMMGAHSDEKFTKGLTVKEISDLLRYPRDAMGRPRFRAFMMAAFSSIVLVPYFLFRSIRSSKHSREDGRL